ncbi:MAG: hypothetical protein JW722_04320 [Demequinaceae bacterium]|nr:hypothetical protein [Demequinaceae bacterium]
MPTWDQTDAFHCDLAALTPPQRAAFILAVTHFVHDLDTGSFRKGLRVKKMAGRTGVWEMTWADDGRATFSFAEPVVEDKVHIVWRRIGTHDILRRP